MEHAKNKFSTQIDEAILKPIKQLAKSEGRQIQSLTEEAFLMLLEKRHQTKARDHVMSAYNKSHDKYAHLYEKLAK